VALSWLAKASFLISAISPARDDFWRPGGPGGGIHDGCFLSTGEMGVLAIIPLVGFFGFGVLDKDDFNGFLWNVVMLAMGGLALGDAVQSSGLLLTISKVRAPPPTSWCSCCR